MDVLPIVGHIPHASTLIPADVRESFVLDDHEVQREMLLLTDWYMDDLFSWLAGSTVFFGVSRLVVDPERFAEDDQEVMASRGMGVIYTKTSDGRELRRVSAIEREGLLKRFYWPHARAVEAKVGACLDEHRVCLFLDCHSFASRPLPFELDQDPNRPEVCLGTDTFHTPSELVASMTTFFRSFGWRVLLNKPYSGTYVPVRFLNKDKRVLSIMIEIRRDLYMDERTGIKSDSFQAVKENVEKLQTFLRASRSSWQRPAR